MNHFAEVNTDADKNVKASAQLSESVMNDMGKPVKSGSADGGIKSQLDQANNSMQRDGILPGLSIDGTAVVSPDKFGGKAGLKPDGLDHQYTNQEIKQMIIDKLKGGKTHTEDGGVKDPVKTADKETIFDGRIAAPDKKVVLDGGLKSEQGESTDKPIVKKPTYLPDPMLVY